MDISTEDRTIGNAELVAHKMLALVGDHPGQFGKLVITHAVGGLFSHTQLVLMEPRFNVERYRAVVEEPWSRVELTNLLSALVDGGLMLYVGTKVCLTRAGHLALTALESGMYSNDEED